MPALDVRQADIFESDLSDLDLTNILLIDTMQERLLTELMAHNQVENRPPLADISIRSWQELLWIRMMTSGGMSKDEQLDLRSADLSEGVFRGVNLARARISHARMDRADFQEARLDHADLQESSLHDARLADAGLLGADLRSAMLYNADLHGASLLEADLRNASLDSANLRSTTLSVADMRNTRCVRANMCGADLRGVKLDIGTSLVDVTLDSHTMLGDIAWGGASAIGIDWQQVPRLGDEDFLKRIQRVESVEERDRAFRDVFRAYRGLAVVLQTQGSSEAASRYRFRARQLERSYFLRKLWLLEWLTSTFFNLITGYGERPARIVVLYSVVISAFTGLYYWMTSVPTDGSLHLSLGEALIVSVTSFHGRGFFPNTLNLGDPVAAAAAAEAVIGVFVEAILVGAIARIFVRN